MVDIKAITDARDARIAELTALRTPIRDFFATTKANVLVTFY